MAKGFHREAELQEQEERQEERDRQMWPQVRSLFVQYEDIKKKIADALAARKLAAGKASA